MEKESKIQLLEKDLEIENLRANSAKKIEKKDKENKIKEVTNKNKALKGQAA